MHSICLSKKNCKNFNIEICISDNNSDFNVLKIIRKYKQKIRIKFNKNKKNIGYALNYLKVLNLARGEYVWVMGDDEILKYNSLTILKNILKNKDVDFIYTNSNTIEDNYISKFKHPFNIKNLPKNMKKFSSIKKNKVTNFFGLIDYNVTWDYLLGICMCIYKRKMFIEKLHHTNMKELKKKGIWTTFHNTAFYTEIYVKAFKKSSVYIQSNPIVVTTHGHKDWNNLYPFIKIVRIPEVIDMYRKNGLTLFSYLRQKNYAVKDFFSCMYKILNSNYGTKYLDIYRHVLWNLFYPSIYITLIKKFLYRIILKKKINLN